VKKPFVPGAPFQVVWNITNACNLKCAHCYENAGKRSSNELTNQEIIRGLEIISKAGVTSIAFSGGEPASNPHSPIISNLLKNLKCILQWQPMVISFQNNLNSTNL
jgi:MoaA/NifB/PqqE/SkfB family radical SAM enzyme